jgi:site-specific recombinase XerD
VRLQPVHRTYLTQEEIDKITQTKFRHPDLARKKDIFLFACYTGLSFIDLTRLKSENILKDVDGSWYIKIARQKTGEESIIPLLPVAEKIIRKYSLSGELRDFNWFISTNQKMNFGLKTIGKHCGILKPLHMHLARHTFATTVTLSHGVPIESVSKMLGHSNIRITQHYAQVVAAKIKSDMARIKEIYR